MPPEVNYGSLPFGEAIDFFRQKLDVKTTRWNELWQGMHARGFMVAGAAREDILTDFRNAVDKVISEGRTLEDFRKDFDNIVATHGWDYNGGRNWRSRVIYDTNLRTAYAAGRYKQMIDPDVLAYRPNWRYRHGASVVPRPLHLSWDKLVLRHDDPWWATHYPPNGWGCSCYVEPLSDRDVEKAGKAGPDQPPDDGTYTWTDKQGRTHVIPRGIDPGWDYNVGEAAYGKPFAQATMDAWKATGEKQWETMTGGNWESMGRPLEVPLDAPKAKPGAEISDTAGIAALLRKQFGAGQKTFTFQAGRLRNNIFVDAEALASHVDPKRSQFLPYLDEVLTDPYEIWMSFEKHKESGLVALRQRLIKGIGVGKGKRMIAVANARGGQLEGWTFIPTGDEKYLNRQRRGKLLWGR